MTYEQIFNQIQQEPRYQKNILYGQPRRGHQEGTVQAHIEELEQNRAKMGVPEGSEEWWKLRVLIHVHDSFKAESKRDVAILDPQSHASLAREFLSHYSQDRDMLNIVQFHDLGYAVYRNWKSNGRVNEQRLRDGLGTIENKDLFLKFAIIDACTASKGREMIAWMVAKVNAMYPETTVTLKDVLLLVGVS